MNKKLLIKIFFFIILIFCQSCAYILGGRSPQLVQVQKGYPDSAKIYYGGNFMGYAPKKIFVPRNANLNQSNNYIEIKADGYQSQKIVMNRKIRYGYFIADIIFLGIPLIGDYATGKIWKPTPSRINYELKRN